MFSCNLPPALLAGRERGGREAVPLLPQRHDLSITRKIPRLAYPGGRGGGRREREGRQRGGAETERQIRGAVAFLVNLIFVSALSHFILFYIYK